MFPLVNPLLSGDEATGRAQVETVEAPLTTRFPLDPAVPRGG